jgi:SAM-dependent methyltransferase
MSLSARRRPGSHDPRGKASRPVSLPLVPLKRARPGSPSRGRPGSSKPPPTGADRPGRPATGAGAAHAAARPGGERKFDRWAASYDLSQLQPVLYGPVHDEVLRYAQEHLPRPGWILDVGCGTGRLPARLVSGYRQAHVVGIDASTAMIKNASAVPVHHGAQLAAAMAEQLPFADGAFDLVVVTLSLSHWRDRTAGLAEIGRVMAPGAALVAADVCPARPTRPKIAWAPRGRPTASCELASLIAAAGLQIEQVEPILSVALFADAALVAARAPCQPGGCQQGRHGQAVRHRESLAKR